MTEHKTIEEMRILEQDYILQITNENRALCNVWKELFETEEEKSNTAALNNEMYKERIANTDREKEELVKTYEQMLKDIELSKCKVVEEIESNKIIIDKQSSENKRLNDEIIKLTEALKLSDENKRKNDKLKDEVKDFKAKDKQIKILEIKYAKLEKESKDVTAELEAMTKEHKILQAQIKEEKAMQEEMSQQLTQKQKDLLKSVKEKEAKIKQQETEHKAEVKNLIAEYEKSLDAANKQIALLTKEQNNVPHKTKDSEIVTRKLRREYEEKILKNEKEYKNKIKEKDLKIDELEYELYIKKEIATTLEENEVEIENLRKEIREYKKKNYDATKLNDKYKKEIANLQKNNDKIGSSKLDHEVDKLRDENEALQAKLNEIEAEMNEKLEALEVENERLQKENKKAIKNDAGKHENEKRKHEKQVKALEAMLEKKEHEIADLRDKILKNSRNMSSQEVRNNKGYEDKITEMEAKINEFQDKIYELENKSVASVLERDASNIVSQQKICGLKAKKSRTISSKVENEESHTDETFADVSKIVENSQQIGVADHTLRNAKRRNESEIDASSLSINGKRKPRTRVTYQRKPQKRAKKENLAVPVIKAPISKTKNLNIDKKEPIENFLSDNKFTPLTQKIGGLFDDLTFTEDSSIFGKNQK